MQYRILIIDDEKIVVNSTKRVLEKADWEIYTATTYEGAKKLLEQMPIDLILLDYKLGATNGLTVLDEITEHYPDTVVIMITAYGNIEIAVQAMKSGAYDFIQKKEQPEFIRFTVQRALENLRLKKEVENLRLAWREQYQVPHIITESPSMKKLLTLAGEYAQSDTTVLITGETGTGKNLLAKYVHLNSHRFEKQFVPINCTAIPRELMESELFGYDTGAFTGASKKGKQGLLEQANYGTLFLDEIGDLNLDLQSKLLHILETKEYFRVGSVNPTKVDVRFIAATNSNLEERVKKKQFRMDLYYRLNVAELPIPPLRERKEDILPLTKYFIDEFNRKFNKSVSQISDELQQFLFSAPWYGNVRELRNFIERAMLLKKNNRLELSDFAAPVQAASGTHSVPSEHTQFSVHVNADGNKNLLHQAHIQMIEQALQLASNNVTQAAALLGIPRTTLNHYLRRFKISR